MRFARGEAQKVSAHATANKHMNMNGWSGLGCVFFYCRGFHDSEIRGTASLTDVDIEIVSLGEGEISQPA